MRAKCGETPAQDCGEWAAYNRDRASKVMLDGKLVDRSTLRALTGFLVKERIQVVVDDRTVRGAMLELAQRREDSEHVSSPMERRPALWKGMGEQVIPANYTPAAIAGALLLVYVVEEAVIDGRRVFRAGTEPTFEQWQASSRRN